MAYTVFARKYRPQSFADVVGQEHVTRTLSNAIETDRVAHAFLFTGVRGVGKTTSARILANRYQSDPRHGNHVGSLCKRLFDELADILGDELKLPRIQPKGQHSITSEKDTVSLPSPP